MRTHISSLDQIDLKTLSMVLFYFVGEVLCMSASLHHHKSRNTGDGRQSFDKMGGLTRPMGPWNSSPAGDRHQGIVIEHSGTDRGIEERFACGVEASFPIAGLEFFDFFGRFHVPESRTGVSNH